MHTCTKNIFMAHKYYYSTETLIVDYKIIKYFQKKKYLFQPI